jgi:hypothetical protein
VVGYAPVDDGVFFVPAFKPGETPTLHFVDLSGGRDRIVSNVPGYFVLDRAFLSVSPDRRRILYSAVPTATSVIQMVDGFR